MFESQPQPANSVPGSFSGTDQRAPVLHYNFSPSGAPLDAQSVGPTLKTSSGILKLLTLLIVFLGLVVGSGLIIWQRTQQTVYQKQKNVVLSVPMKNVNWQDLGDVFEPIITISVKTRTGHEDADFLLDSGAVVSSLPREWAEKTGQDLAMLKRSTFRGFGNATSFAYHGEMMVLLGEEDHPLPVVFTEASGTKSLLGRKGFFEDYSIYFNHQAKQIEIRK